MARQFLTGINLNKNELLNARIQNLATAPSNPVAGQIYYDTDTNQITLWDGTAWVSLAAGGDVSSQISAAIDALTTDDIEEGSTNLYYTDTRAKDDAATLLTGATLTNITITGDGEGLTITAENGGIQDLTGFDTDDLSEGSTNLYFTNQRALDATNGVYDLAGSASTAESNASSYAEGIVDALDTDDIEEGSTNVYFTEERARLSVSGTLGISYDSSTGAFSANLEPNGGLENGESLDGSRLQIDRTTVDTWYDAAGAAASAQSAAESYADGLASNYDAAGSAAAAQAAAESYADGLVQGLNIKNSVRVASTANYSGNFYEVTVIDGVTLADGDRVLLKNQSSLQNNGIYVYDLGTTTLSIPEYPEKGDYVLVTDGTYAATGWVVTSVIGPDNMTGYTWTQFSAANEYTAGDGIDITGNEISVALDSDSLSVSGSGLKANLNALGGLDNDGGLFVKTSGGITLNESGVVVLDTANGYGVRKYAVGNDALTATSGSVSWTVTHGLGTRDVTVQVFDTATYDQVEVDVVRTSTSVVTLSWVSGNVSADAYRVVVVG